MPENEESFDEKLVRWTVPEMEYELTRKNVYGPKKLKRLEQEIAKRKMEEAEADSAETEDEPVNWVRMAVIVVTIFGIVGFALALYFD